MQAQEVIAQAAGCQTYAQVDAFLGSLARAISSHPSYRHLDNRNKYGALETPGMPFMSMEFVRRLSLYHLVAISPQIRDGELTIRVEVFIARDGLGLDSRDYDWVEELCDAFTLSPEDDLTVSLTTARNKAVELHTELMERAGVPHDLAKEVAKKTWE